MFPDCVCMAASCSAAELLRTVQAGEKDCGRECESESGSPLEAWGWRPPLIKMGINRA